MKLLNLVGASRLLVEVCNIFHFLMAQLLEFLDMIRIVRTGENL